MGNSFLPGFIKQIKQGLALKPLIGRKAIAKRRGPDELPLFFIVIIVPRYPEYRPQISQIDADLVLFHLKLSLICVHLRNLRIVVVILPAILTQRGE